MSFSYACSRFIYTYLGRDVEWPEADGALGPLGHDAAATTAAHDDVAAVGTEMPRWVGRSS